jgi:hypothetical protein
MQMMVDNAGGTSTQTTVSNTDGITQTTIDNADNNQGCRQQSRMQMMINDADNTDDDPRRRPQWTTQTTIEDADEDQRHRL